MYAFSLHVFSFLSLFEYTLHSFLFYPILESKGISYIFAKLLERIHMMISLFFSFNFLEATPNYLRVFFLTPPPPPEMLIYQWKILSVIYIVNQ